MAPSVQAPQPAQLTPTQIRAALQQLQRRVDELAALDVSSLSGWGDAVLDDLARRIDVTLANVFGYDTVEYDRYHFGARAFDLGPQLYAPWKPDMEERIAKAIKRLNSAMTILKERLAHSGDTAASTVITAYKGLDLHPEIARSASRLYRDEHYANAVEAAVKGLNSLVRLKSGLDLDGTTLMERAFSPSNPILKFNDLSDQSDRDEQKGYMIMFSGAVAGLRNPRAHRFMQDDPERALEFIAFVSLLAKLLDEATK